MMPPVVFALLAFVVAPFRSQASLHLENLALRHQLTSLSTYGPSPVPASD